MGWQGAVFVMMCMAAGRAPGLASRLAGRGPAPLAEIIDRVAVVVGTSAITESQIDREIRLTAFVNEEKPDFSSAARREAADRLINQTLVRQEMEQSRYPVPEAGEEVPMADAIKKRYTSAAEFRAKLTGYGISEDDLNAFLAWQLTFLEFVDIRFRPGIQVQESDIRAYFKQQKLPESDYRALHDKIEEKLIGAQVDQALDGWLKEARGRTRIEFRKEVFQ
jgi:hypothetical protein